ncbi:MAG: aspartate-semialdehyde dehydrogenase [Ignavibacteriae bacterium]|nr:aspartate-semialdehyde dehydrogenase [Ignavibacteria bacterium]MBI3365481.1 aspartate-semialdehyde dehydrogenase [Ignavibacteriota bacterium]
MRQFNVAVVGATGLVGRKMIQVLEERNFPVGNLRLLASKKSVGKKITFRDMDYAVEELTPNSFMGIDIALFSAGAAVSKEFAPVAARAGALAIDNSSAWRMDKDVPLVVPEVNPDAIVLHKGIIANPNCSAIQMVVALKPLHDRWKIKRVVVSTYQSVTGAGNLAVRQLESELAKDANPTKKFPHPIAFNVLPQVDVFVDGGYTKEEMKMVNETKKIMGDDSINVTATCVRVPVIGGHSEAVNLEFENPYTLEEVYDVLRRAPGICLQDDVNQSIYPMPIWSHECDEVFVGRIRRDETIKNGLNLWIVSDNLRKGAATNAVQIAEEWINDNSKVKSKK